MNLLSAPMGANPRRDRLVGRSDDGGQVYVTPTGQRYTLYPQGQPKPSFEAVMDDASVFDLLGEDVPVFPEPSRMQRGAEGAAAAYGMVGNALAQGVTAPGRAAAGETVTNEDVLATALDWGLLGLPVGAATAPEGAVGIFAGRRARTADTQALARAEAMAAGGADRADIWRETGWFQGVDGKWRFEIDDRAFNFRGDTQTIADNMRSRAREIERGIDARNAALREQPDLFPKDLRRAHGNLRRDAKELRREAGSSFGPEWNPETLGQRAQYALEGGAIEAYPDIARKTIVRTQQGGPQGLEGSFNQDKNQLSLYRGADDARSVALHEYQHAVQSTENFARGGSPSDFVAEDFIPLIEEADALEDSLVGRSWRAETPEERARLKALSEEAGRRKRELRRKAAEYKFDQYKKLAGEVEARNVEARRDMTADERRAVPPWETQDVLDEDQLLRFGGTGPQMSEGKPIRAYHGSPQSADDILALADEDMVTLFHGTTQEGGEGIRRTGQLRSAGEPSVYLTNDPAGGGYGDGTVAAVRVRRRDLQIDDEFPDGRADFRIDLSRPGGLFPVEFIEIVRKYGIAGAAALLGMSEAEVIEGMEGI